jgi:hypothetical protein
MSLTQAVCYLLNTLHKTFMTVSQMKRVEDPLGSAALKHHRRLSDKAVYTVDHYITRLKCIGI